ncbi:hypothetical protein ACX80E_06335 [Arthrobacter sp. TMN-49]
MNTPKNKALLLPLTAGLLVALAGCGGAQEASTSPQDAGSATSQAAPTSAAPLTVPSAKELFPKVNQTIKSATSVAIVGEMTRGTTTVKIKMSGSRDGSNSLAEVTKKGATSTLLTANGATYLKADKEFFTQNVGQETADVVDSLVGEKWITVTDASKFGNYSISSLLESFGGETLKESDLGTISDKSVVDLNGAKAFKYTGKKGILWIAAEGDPFMLQMQPQDSAGEDPGVITFSDWNSVAPQKAPSKAETVSIPGV